MPSWLTYWSLFTNVFFGKFGRMLKIRLYKLQNLETRAPIRMANIGSIRERKQKHVVHFNQTHPRQSDTGTESPYGATLRGWPSSRGNAEGALSLHQKVEFSLIIKMWHLGKDEQPNAIVKNAKNGAKTRTQSGSGRADRAPKSTISSYKKRGKPNGQNYQNIPFWYNPYRKYFLSYYKECLTLYCCETQPSYDSAFLHKIAFRQMKMMC